MKFPDNFEAIGEKDNHNLFQINFQAAKETQPHPMFPMKVISPAMFQLTIAEKDGKYSACLSDSEEYSMGRFEMSLEELNLALAGFDSKMREE